MILADVSATYAVVRERPEWDLKLDLCDAHTMFYQLSYQANWGLAGCGSIISLLHIFIIFVIYYIFITYII